MSTPSPRIEPIVHWLTEQIESGRLKVGEKIPSEYTLAEQFGVNKTTANKAVAQLVAHGYLRRHRGAAGTRVSRSDRYPKGRIACLITLGNSFVNQILRGIHHQAFIRGYELIFTTAHALDDFPRMWHQIQEAGVDAVLMLDHGVPPADLSIPCVHVDSRYTGATPCHWVGCDNFEGSYRIAETLYRAGHRQIAYVYNHETHYTQRHRKAGFERAIDELSGGTCRATNYYAPKVLKHECHNIWERLRQQQDLTAIAFTNDLAMLPFIRHLIEHDCWPLRHTVLAGFGNLWETQSIHPCLTADQHPGEIGMLACQRAIDLIEGRLIGDVLDPGFTDQTVPVQLINEHRAAIPDLPARR